jgi:predicted phage terminase large subunit-like protein
MNETIELRPQPRQEQFLSSSADIAIYGGAAGGGKTWSLLIEPLRHAGNKDFGAVIFRRTIPEITSEGGLWDEAGKIYPLLSAAANQNARQYTFPSGSRVTFSHMQHEKDKESWKSAQIPLIMFDQLETFTQSQFFYMLSRNRSMCGVRPYVRATANPYPNWLAEFLSWWIGDDGYAIPERSGVVRWMIRENDVTYWGDTFEEMQNKYPSSTPKSVTFILSTIYDNRALLDVDKGYLANLQALSLVDRERLLGDGTRGGNWKIQPAAGKVFNRAWFRIVDVAPSGGQELRGWDLAATAKKLADYTASCKGKVVSGNLYILDMTADQIEPARTDENMKNIAAQDGKVCAIRWEQEGGASGKRDSRSIAQMLAGYDARGVVPQGDKVTRAKPLAAQAEAGNVYLVRGEWNEEFLIHMHAFAPDCEHDDIADAASVMYNSLTSEAPVEYIDDPFAELYSDW